MLDLDDIADVVVEAVRAATAPLREENDVLRKRLEAIEAREIPSAIRGEKGDVGETGPQGERGPAGEVDMGAIKAMIDEAVASLPSPEKGERGEPGEKGERGDDGAPGMNGIGLADALIDNSGNLVLTMTDGSTKALGMVVGKDGENGQNGAPGATFTLDDFDIEQIDDRTFTFKFQKENVVHSFEFEFPVPIMRGAWKEGSYRKGDMVVWGGSLWTAMKETNAKPDSPDSGWMIAARKGRDGKDLKKD